MFEGVLLAAVQQVLNCHAKAEPVGEGIDTVRDVTLRRNSANMSLRRR
jgi:hypothetical protein